MDIPRVREPNSRLVEKAQGITLVDRHRQNLLLALRDLQDGISSIHVWSTLGWLEIKQRYRRSTLGPFWLTISTGAMIAGMGPLYSRLFNQDLSAYFPYLTVSFIVWLFISGLITDSCLAFISAEGFIKQVKLPLTIHILRLVWKNLIIFGHNFIIVLIVLLFYRQAWDWHLLLVPLGVLMIVVNGLWVGILFGSICARFRDIPQIVTSLVLVAFFLTPIMWKPETLGKYRWTADINPLYHFLEIVRTPLLGEAPNLLSWKVVIFITLAGYATMLLFFSRYRARIAYWV
jgi:ABC-type polysaccharide/polyol phosphate export permease